MGGWGQERVHKMSLVSEGKREGTGLFARTVGEVGSHFTNVCPTRLWQTMKMGLKRGEEK